MEISSFRSKITKIKLDFMSICKQVQNHRCKRSFGPCHFGLLSKKEKRKYSKLSSKRLKCQCMKKVFDNDYLKIIKWNVSCKMKSLSKIAAGTSPLWRMGVLGCWKESSGA